jgi:hypothetical protein
MFRACITSTLAVAAALALAQGASATTFCVLPENTCPGPETFPTVTDAFAAATNNAGADKVSLGAATYTAPTAAGFVYNDASAGGAIEIEGHGAATVLTGPSGATRVLYLQKAAAGSIAHDFSVHLPASLASFAEGVTSKGTDLSNITVDADATQSNPHSGIVLSGDADLDHATVTLDVSGSVQAIGVLLQNGDTSVVDSTVSSRIGVETTNGGTIDRVRITAKAEGIEVDNDVPVLIRNCLIRLLASQQGQTAIGVLNASAVTVNNCTLIGNGNSQSVGIVVSSFSNYSSDVDVANALIKGFGSALQRSATNGLQSTISIRYSDYDPSNLLAAGPGATNEGAGNGFHADPGFVDEAGGDYRLRFDSPLVEAGDVQSLFGTGDLDGKQRNADGDGAGGAVPDIGAFEYQRYAPELKIQGPSSGQPGDVLDWNGSAIDSDPGETPQLAYGWKVDGGPLEPGTALQHTFTTNGTHHVVLVVTDPAGVEQTLDLPVQIGAPAGGGGGGGGSDNDPPPAAGSAQADSSTQAPSSNDPRTPDSSSAGNGPARHAPVITRLRVGGRWVSLTVDEPATIDVRVQRRTKTGLHLVRHRRTATRGGALKIALGHLRAGRYRVVVTATDAVGNRSIPKARRLRRR